MTTLQSSAQAQLRQYIEKLERLDEERKALVGDMKDVMLEAKGTGFDVKAIRKILILRKKSKSEREEEDAILDTYKSALGMLADTPLGAWAADQDKSPLIYERCTTAQDFDRIGKAHGMPPEVVEAAKREHIPGYPGAQP